MVRPKLKHVDEFRALLQNYQPDARARQTLKDTELVLLMGPTSSGRNTIITELLKTGDYHSIISDTTRPKRTNNGVLERDGVEYWFRSEEEVLEDVKNGRFLEAAIVHNQQVSGASIRELEAARATNKIAVNEVTPDGAHSIWLLKPEAKFVFILPPSFETWMQRLRARGEMSEDEVRIRLNSALAEIPKALLEPYYKLVINDEFHACTQLLHLYFKQGEFDEVREQEARQHATRLLNDTRSYLRD